MTQIVQAQHPHLTGDTAKLPQEESDSSYFTVFVGDELLGLSVRKTQTIFRITALTPIPLGPGEIAGLVNLRGKILTVVSLRRRLGLTCEGGFLNSLAITMEHNRESFALIVDKVGDVLTLEPSMRVPVPPHFDPARLKLTSGLYRVNELLVPVLDIDAVFSFGN
jgi:purine-binding chemotaxis protein CheW